MEGRLGQAELRALREARQRANGKTAARSARKVDKQKKAAAIRGKFGIAGRPQPVTIKRLDGTVVGVVRHDLAPLGKPKVPASSPEAPWVDRRARRAGFESYQAYLASPHWLALRRKVFARDGRHCVDCSRGDGLQAHHLTYARLGHERLSDLVTLCKGCHRKRHR